MANDEGPKDKPAQQPTPPLQPEAPGLPAAPEPETLAEGALGIDPPDQWPDPGSGSPGADAGDNG